MEADGSAAPAARLKIGGAWSGILEVRLDTWTVPMLRAEVARRSGGGDPSCINLICAGKLLMDGDGAASLLQLGIKNNAKMLATCVSADRGKALDAEAAEVNAKETAEAERSNKLARIREAAKALSQRHSDGSVPLEDYNIELEDQSGQAVSFGSESDKRAVMMGLMLHTNSKSLMNKQNYKDALDVLTMAEEAFSLCDPKFIEMIDNVPILQLDIVWCYFMLRDISCLSLAGRRLVKARKGFEHSHGKDSTRFRLLQDGRHSELAIYLRLDLLEGVVAYHSGNFEEARKSLSSAQAKYMQLQVPDEALSLLMGMGYKERAAKRALRMTCQDIQSAVDFLVEERAKKARRKEENIKRQKEIMEQKKYGKTSKNKAVDLQRLQELVSIGFEKYLAAEALRINENDTQKALDLLTDPEKNCSLQSQIESRRKRVAAGSSLTAGDIEEIISMGYERAAVMDALNNVHTKKDLLRVLGGIATGNNDQQAGSNPPTHDQAGSSGAAANSLEDDHMDGEEHSNDGRDTIMENELANELTGDPLADYDIEVAKEGEAIAEYLSLLESTTSAS
ncbi:uncharacterized protein [Typha angustifolia]|uniref:uncharacterized protein n=1 Tax=Typha angustifolia TaxID=59011 RepID=UPI003C2F4FE8